MRSVRKDGMICRVRKELQQRGETPPLCELKFKDGEPQEGKLIMHITQEQLDREFVFIGQPGMTGQVIVEHIESEKWYTIPAIDLEFPSEPKGRRARS